MQAEEVRQNFTFSHVEDYLESECEFIQYSEWSISD